jgi:hypothetical protein
LYLGVSDDPFPDAPIDTWPFSGGANQYFAIDRPRGDPPAVKTTVIEYRRCLARDATHLPKPAAEPPPSPRLER